MTDARRSVKRSRAPRVIMLKASRPWILLLYILYIYYIYYTYLVKISTLVLRWKFLIVLPLLFNFMYTLIMFLQNQRLKIICSFIVFSTLIFQRQPYFNHIHQFSTLNLRSNVYWVMNSSAENQKSYKIKKSVTTILN